MSEKVYVVHIVGGEDVGQAFMDKADADRAVTYLEAFDLEATMLEYPLFAAKRKRGAPRGPRKVRITTVGGLVGPVVTAPTTHPQAADAKNPAFDTPENMKRI